MQSASATTLEVAVSILRKKQALVLVFIDVESYCRTIAARLLSNAA